MKFELNDLINRIVIFFKVLTIFFNDKIVIPIKNGLKALINFIKDKIIKNKNFFKLTFFKSSKYCKDDNEHSDTAASQPIESVTEAYWKTKALEDFKLWLSEISSEQPPVMTATPDSCDLYTMLSEFTALRQEIRMQNREQHRTVSALNSVKGVTDEYGEIYTLFKEKTNQIAQLEQNIRNHSEKKAAASFFDVRDSLVRGYRASVEMSERKGFFSRPPKDINTICEGYEMAVSRFDKALSIMDIEPIETDNMQFNPETMKVVGTRQIPNIEDGKVIESVSGGFIRGREVLRFAKVIVAQAQNDITND